MASQKQVDWGTWLWEPLLVGLHDQVECWINIVDGDDDGDDYDGDDDETEMSRYEGTPGGSWRDSGASRKI